MATRKSESARDAQRKLIEQTVWRVPAKDDDPHFFVTSNMSKLLITRDRLRALLDLHGFNAIAASLPETSTLTAIQRALADVATADEFVKKTSKASDSDVTFRLVRLTPDERGAHEVSVEHGVFVSYLKRPEKGEPNVVYSSADAEHTLAPLVAQHVASLTNSDIHEAVVLFVLRQLRAIDLRDKGGTYLVPAGATDVVKRLRRFFADLAQETGARCHLSTIALVNTEDTREDVRYHARETVISEMKTLRTRLRDMLSARRVDEQGRTSVKPETVAGYLDELSDLGKRAMLYRDVAALGLTELNAGLRALQVGYQAVAQGLSVDDFDATLAHVEHALARAEDAREHAIATPEDAEDPFAEDAPDVSLDDTSVASQRATTTTMTSASDDDDFDPFAEDAADVALDDTADD